MNCPLSNMAEHIEKAAPEIAEHFPLIETTDISRQRNWLCSSFLLANGQKIKTFMPKSYSIKDCNETS